MNIIFLDVDGVLNNWQDAENIYKKTKKPVIGFEWPFCKDSMIALRDLVNQTDSKIAISSSWRTLKECF